MKKYFKITMICFSCVLLFGCGYSFASRGESIDKNIQKVYVESFDNKTAQAEVENYVRAAFINQFIQNSRPLSHLKNNLAAEERATIIMEIVFQDNSNGKVIWSSSEMTDYADYTLNEDINLLSNTRKQALMKLSNDIVEKAFNLMMSGF